MTLRFRPCETIDELHAEELAYLERMFRSGAPVAAAAALDYCRKFGVRPPPWVLNSVVGLLCDLMKREKSNSRGRSCGYVGRHRRDMIDYARWSEVNDLRRKQIELKEEVATLRSLPNIPEDRVAERQKVLDWVGHTLQQAFECTAMLLAGSEACGSPDAVKRSYFKVERINKDPNQRMRHHMLDRSFLAMIGIKTTVATRPGRKVVPIYELTLRN